MRTVSSGVKCLQMLLFLQSGLVWIMRGTFTGMTSLCSIDDDRFVVVGVSIICCLSPLLKLLVTVLSLDLSVYDFSPTLDFVFEVLDISSAEYSPNGLINSGFH